MQNLITTVLFLFAATVMQAQIDVEIKSAHLAINNNDTDQTKIHLIDSANVSKIVEIKNSDFTAMDETEKIFEKIIKYKKVAANSKIIFWLANDQETNAEAVFFCIYKNIFTKDVGKCSDDVETKKIGYINIAQIPFPQFQNRNDDILINNKSSRYLVIDANPNQNKKINNSLFKAKNSLTFGKTDIFEDNFEKADALPINGSLTLFIRDYNFHNIEKVTVEILGADYTYTQTIKDILKNISKDVPSSDNSDNPAATSSKFNLNRNTDLDAILKALQKYKYLNLNDLYVIEQYKKTIYEFYTENLTSFIKEDATTMGEIINWYPDYLSITPIAITIPENDEVTIKVKIKNSNDSNISDIKVGTFKTSGGLGFNLGGMFYITNLKNNSIYTKPGTTTDKVKAYINTGNQSSVGLGMNAEIYLRSGYLLRPTLNMGFFIPFDEDLTPFGAIGPGFSISSKKVKFSFSWGLAIGKVNAIKKQYLEEFDPTGITNEQLGEKGWEFKNYFGFGLTYNL